jgi:hypothetical protein
MVRLDLHDKNSLAWWGRSASNSDNHQLSRTLRPPLVCRAVLSHFSVNTVIVVGIGLTIVGIGHHCASANFQETRLRLGSAYQGYYALVRDSRILF